MYVRQAFFQANVLCVRKRKTGFKAFPIFLYFPLSFLFPFPVFTSSRSSKRRYFFFFFLGVCGLNL